MGRSGGGPSVFRRWHELGGRVLVSVCKQKKDGRDLAAVKEALYPVSNRAHNDVVSSSDSASSSKCGPRKFLDLVTAVTSLGPRAAQHHHCFSGRTLSTATTLCPTTNATSSGDGGHHSLRPVENKRPIAPFESRPGVLLTHVCGHARAMSAAIITTTAEYQSETELSSGNFEQEAAYPIFSSDNSNNNNNLPISPVKSLRRGVVGGSITNPILDPGISMPLLSRSSKLPLHSVLPSFRSHRLGDATSSSLQGVGATASMPAGEVVDWHHQRLGRVTDYDSRFRHPKHSSSHSDAEPDDIFIPVKAFYISRSVDLKSLAREPFLEVTTSRNNLIIRCADRPPHSPVTADNPEMACLGFLKERYMVAFQYGSVVFFNFGDLEEAESLDIVRKYCSDEFETRKDDYGVLVRPTLAEWSEGGHDRVMLRKLDIDNIRVISSILGQSIAFDHYARKVDEMVTTFSDMNRGMEQTGTFTMTRKSLFQLVAAANTILADVILRLGFLERSDAAWKDANYAQIWEYLRDDFELDERFESLDFKLNIIQHNVRFFLEILQNRKSDTLEWIIIILISGEICLSLFDILQRTGAI